MRSKAFAAPFIVIAFGAISYGIIRLIATPPDSWTLVITVIASVIICEPFKIHVGRAAGFPLVGVSITMLAIQPSADFPFLGACVWTIGLAISKLLRSGSTLHALYMTGLGSAGAFAFTAIQTGLTGLGIWLLPSLFVSTAAYYTVFLLGESARQRIVATVDSGFTHSGISLTRLGFVVLVVSLTAVLMNYVDSFVIPWLENNPKASLRPFVVLLAASIFYILAQHTRSARVEHRLNAVVDAALELPRESGSKLASALQNRARSIVQANDVELRSSAPGSNEIGATVSLEFGGEQYLVASRKVGGGPFVREDERALANLAYMASEAARIQYERDSLERRANSDPSGR